MVNVADGAETERHAAENQGENDANQGDTPSSGLGKEHEGPANGYLPADLEMERERAQKRPHDTAPAPEDDKGSGGTTDLACLHAVGGDFVVALFRLGGEGHDEAHVHEEDAGGKANAEVMAICLFHGEKEPRQEEIDAADGANGGDPVGNGTNRFEALWVDPVGERTGQAAFYAVGDFLAETPVDD